jgi:AmiR/NasT family two-component response regulator
MQPQMRFRVLIVEDEALVSDVIQNELEKSGHEVVGRAADGRLAVELAQSLRPDVVLMDIAMPEIDGLKATLMIQEECPTPVVLLSAHDHQALVTQASLVGAGAYLIKPSGAAELTRAMTIAVARFSDLMELRRLNADLQKLNKELQDALVEIKTLKGILPICATCKKIRDDEGYWHQVEVYVRDHSDAVFSHGICPDCLKEFYPDFVRKK